jgi:hypothetical protein
MLLLAASMVASSRAATAQSAVPRPLAVPSGRSILVDGRVEAEEWRDARSVAAGPGVRLLLKRDARFLYVAVARTESAVFGVNLYLGAPHGVDYLNLHASAKLAERRGRAGAWPDWVWWNNAGWTANVARGEDFERRRFLPDDAKEFQIALRRLPAHDFVLSLDIESAAGATPLLVDLPERDGLHWLTLRR